MGVALGGSVRVTSSIIFGSLLCAAIPARAHTVDALRHQVIGLTSMSTRPARSQTSQVRLTVTCSPNPCTIKQTVNGSRSDIIIGGHAISPDAIRTSVATTSGAANLFSLTASGNAASETITASGPVISATDVTTTTLALPSFPSSAAAELNAVDSTAQNGVVTFTHVPFVATEPYSVVVSTQSAKLDSAVVFYFKQRKARP